MRRRPTNTKSPLRLVNAELELIPDIEHFLDVRIPLEPRELCVETNEGDKEAANATGRYEITWFLGMKIPANLKGFPSRER
jgi:hypothetical protein